MSGNKAYLFSLLLFHIIIIFVVLQNFPRDSYFLGWDSIHPEFNFWMNLQRNIFGSWQENYGLGTLGGHGFSALLPHTIFLYILSLLLPIATLRPTFIFVCLYAGGLGLYVFVRHMLRLLNNKNYYSSLTHYLPFVSLFSSVYYMFNLGTTMMFHVELEVFIIAFAAFPWLFWIMLRTLHRFSKRNLLLFFLINFLSTSQGFIPSVFLAYFLGIIVFLFISIVFERKLIKKTIFLIVLTLVINSYWMIPVAYFSVYRGDTRAMSYDSSQLTREFVAKNKQYSTLSNAAVLKGFTFDNKVAADTTYFFENITEHFNKPLVNGVGYVFFALSVLGLLGVFTKIIHPLTVSLGFVYIVLFTAYSSGQFPFSVISDFFVEHLPLYGDAFRAPLTKFVMSVAFVYSVFMGLGLLNVLQWLYSLKKRFFIKVVCVLSFALLIWYALPSFQGYFLSERFKLKIPSAYIELMNYMKSEAPGRITDLPQDNFQGWFRTTWGYDGSGFIWFGIPQPITARTFDVWSNYNENYYWELVYALRRKDYTRFDLLMQKYDISWLVYDENQFNLKDPKAFAHLPDLLDHLHTSPKYDLVKKFQSEKTLPIFLFKYQESSVNTFVSLDTGLPNIGPRYNWSENDAALPSSHKYITTNRRNYDRIYPFRSLFEKRSTDNDSLTIKSNEKEIVLSQSIHTSVSGYTLHVPSQMEADKYIGIKLRFIPSQRNVTDIQISYLFPEIYLNDTLLTTSHVYTEDNVPFDLSKAHELILNSQTIASNPDGSYDGVLYKDLDNILFILDKEGKVLAQVKVPTNITYEYQNVIPSLTGDIFKVHIPTVTNDPFMYRNFKMNLTSHLPKPCAEDSNGNNLYEIGNAIEEKEYIRLSSFESKQCISYFLSDLPTDNSYMVSLSARHIAGVSPKFYVTNNRKIDYLNVFVDAATRDWKDFHYILPATIPNEIGYDLWFENASFLKERTINDFGGFEIARIPYNFLNDIHFAKESTLPSANTINDITVYHPNETYYAIDITKATNNSVLSLSQRFDLGWKAYSLSSDKAAWNKLFPFLFGDEIQEHVLVNNWKNGWFLSEQKCIHNGCRIVIIYWPQYLQYIGYIVLILTGIGLTVYRQK